MPRTEIQIGIESSLVYHSQVIVYRASQRTLGRLCGFRWDLCVIQDLQNGYQSIRNSFEYRSHLGNNHPDLP